MNIIRCLLLVIAVLSPVSVSACNDNDHNRTALSADQMREHIGGAWDGHWVQDDGTKGAVTWYLGIRDGAIKAFFHNVRYGGFSSGTGNIEGDTLVFDGVKLQMFRSNEGTFHLEGKSGEAKLSLQRLQMSEQEAMAQLQQKYAEHQAIQRKILGE